MRVLGWRRGIGALAVATAVGLTAWGCQDDPVRPSSSQPSEPLWHLGDEQPVRMTGGGRIDYPPGTAEKNTPESRTFQTFGFNVGDKDGDGSPEGELQFVDHTPENRVNGRPVSLHSVSWATYRRTVDACRDAGIEATGTLEVKNTGERHEFRMYACDNGEPGTKDPHDEFSLDVYYPDGVKRWGWGGKLTGGNLQAHFDQPPRTVPTTGSLEVAASTTGSELDPDGYTVTVDGSRSQDVETNGSVTFVDLEAGDHSVALSDVAANCTVTGENPRTVSVPAGGTARTTFEVTCTAAASRMTGLGHIGNGLPLPGQNRQEFDLDVTSGLSGTVFYIDYGVVRDDGTLGSMRVDPTLDPETGITAYSDTTTLLGCNDPADGVDFRGIGRLDTGDLVEFEIRTCDNGPLGVAQDIFSIAIPSRPYFRGPDFLSGGNLVKTTG